MARLGFQLQSAKSFLLPSTARFLVAHGAKGQGGSGTAALLILAAGSAGPLDPFPRRALRTTKAVDHKEGAMPPLEQEMNRFAVTVTICVRATDPDEAALIVERLFAGRFDFDLVVSSESEGGE